jgi:uncharacterized protein with FMN-binding domain
MKTLVLSIMALPAAIAPVPALAQGLPVAGSGYADGTYTGPSANAYYGNIQIQVIVKAGRISGFRLLDYPSHTGTSQMINRQALPMLAQEVLSAQSSLIDFVSGATLSSNAFIQSVSGALNQASTGVPTPAITQ